MSTSLHKSLSHLSTSPVTPIAHFSTTPTQAHHDHLHPKPTSPNTKTPTHVSSAQHTAKTLSAASITPNQ